ncbi:VOC family protein [Nakamurella deserti]|uniref:VOC family protein n=1 Tax=Nakamurella deserti TaxID=2164074 RepID=UPI000DBE5073|nr:VOC family protein [Nakamurella deserti]
MTITRLLAQMTVSDLPAAERWYGRLFGTGPDARPMDGLLEWHLSPAFGVQVYVEPDRAGRSSMVLGVDDVTAEAGRLTAAAIDHDGAQDATTVRILPLTDADGNRIVFTSPLR